jgi:putative Mg2+ transporter-C (MgtC) family protein
MILALASISVVFGRLLLAAVVGGVIGLERETRGRAAGLRTTMLACVSSTAAILMAERMFTDVAGGGHDYTASSRVMQGILTGIGFLGAGAINREGRLVHGLTSAAILWVATILGLIIGSGQWGFALLGLGLTMFILVVLRRFESHLHRDWFGTLVVTVQIAGISDAEIKQRLQSAHLEVKHVCLHYDMEAKERTLRCDIKYHKNHLFHLAEQVVSELAQCRGVLTVDWTHG